MAPRKKKIEEIYKEMDEITHVLSRPGMYVGSIKDETRQMFIYDSDESMMTMKDVNYAPAMLKVFDEILSNSCDEYRRDTNLGLTKIEVTAKYDGTITIKDNGCGMDNPELFKDMSALKDSSHVGIYNIYRR